MKYAFMTFSTPQLTWAEVLDTAKRFGYDGVEPRLDAKHRHGVEVAAPDEQRVAIRALAAEKGIAIACLATSLAFADPAKTDEMIQSARARIDLAGDLGAPAIRVFGGKIPEKVTREDAIELVANSVRAVADQAAERGVALCMETHDDWCDPVQVAAVLRRANHPAVAANWDIMHPILRGGATMESAFESLKPWIRHLHVHDGGEDGKLTPIGQGKIDHRRALALLKQIKYQGFISGEWIDWEPYETHLPRELAALKQCEGAG
jgi:sugar phosphate isomerase/epimerase